MSNQPGRVTWGVIIAVLLSVLLAYLYHATFERSADYISTNLNSIAFVDTEHYRELLEGRRYRECFDAPSQCHVEHQRKIVHHVLFFVVADGVMTAVRVFSTGGDLLDLWWVAPILGAAGFLLAFAYFRRHVGESAALAGSVAFALIPATWVYSAVPETWILTGLCVLVALNLRHRAASFWLVGGVVGVLALNNFLLLLLAGLMFDPGQPVLRRITNVLRAGSVALASWLLCLTLLGLLWAPDFLPTHFFEATVQFKSRLGENLSIIHPGRWAYNALNGWIAPFVLNQSDLNFGRYAVLDSARSLPLGALAVVGLVTVAVFVAKDLLHQVRTERFIDQVPGLALYLVAVFVATGLALYYESFLYAPLVTPLVLLLVLRSLDARPRGVLLMWVIAVVWSLNAGQQMMKFNHALVEAEKAALSTPTS